MCFSWIYRSTRTQLENCRSAKRLAEHTLRDFQERDIRPYQDSILVEEKKKELAQLQLDLDRLNDTCDQLKTTADYWQQRARKQKVDGDKKAEQLVQEHDKKVQEGDEKFNKLEKERNTTLEQFKNFAKAMPALLRGLEDKNRKSLQKIAVEQQRLESNQNVSNNIANFIEKAVQDAPENGVLSAEAIQLLTLISSPPIVAIVPAPAPASNTAPHEHDANDESLWNRVFSRQ